LIAVPPSPLPQSETAADPPTLKLRRTGLDALLPSILDKAFKGEL